MTPGVLDVAKWDYPGTTGDVLKSLALAKADGITGVVAKCTQGKDYVDPTWIKWHAACAAMGLDFGAYHFASNTEPGEDQADWFMKNVDAAGCDPATTALMLDFERNPDHALTMTVPMARAFAKRIKERLGFFPLLYGDQSFLSQIVDPHDPLGACPLWPAVYGGSGPRIPLAWAKWTLWQYTDGKYAASVGPRETPGFSRMDRSVYRGTADELRAAWPRFGG